MFRLTCRVGAHNSRYAHDTRLYPIGRSGFSPQCCVHSCGLQMFEGVAFLFHLDPYETLWPKLLNL